MQGTPRDLQQPFDRVTYREGQLMTGRDLQDDAGTNQRLRRLHTRYLHDTWGIALGFTVSAQTGDDSIHVGSGLALDTAGREILLGKDLSLPVPNTTSATRLMLVATYQGNEAYRNLKDLGTICFAGGLDPRLEQPVFAWRTQDTLAAGADVPLAAASVMQGALTAPPDLSVRRYADQMTRPHIGFGSFDFHPTRSDRYVHATVDTTDSGFSSTPQYFARLDIADATANTNKFPVALVATFGYIDKATEASFIYSFPFPGGDWPEALMLRVTWLGLERVSGCEPVFSLLNFYRLGGFLLFKPTFSKVSQTLIPKEVLA
ncbi:MAG: hypothetical protein QOK38_623 [Acidobacteriaceae bacterium]|jgi:hypothetical protein|nr:hypothetical protein [Acidobacteriaceae bacterium]